MPTIKETYGAPKNMRTPVAARVWLFPGVLLLLVVGGWLLFPHTPVVAGLLALLVLLVVGLGVGRILTSRQLTDLPPRRPVKPPSID